jgi:hypothetical protein
MYVNVHFDLQTALHNKWKLNLMQGVNSSSRLERSKERFLKKITHDQKKRELSRKLATISKKYGKFNTRVSLPERPFSSKQVKKGKQRKTPN